MASHLDMVVTNTLANLVTVIFFFNLYCLISTNYDSVCFTVILSQDKRVFNMVVSHLISGLMLCLENMVKVSFFFSFF